MFKKVSFHFSGPSVQEKQNWLNRRKTNNRPGIGNRDPMTYYTGDKKHSKKYIFPPHTTTPQKSKSEQYSTVFLPLTAYY